MNLTYDPNGRLLTSSSGGMTTRYLYDGDKMVAEYNGAALVRRYVHGAGTDEPLVWYDGAALTEPRWLHTDHQGSVVATSDGSGIGTVYAYGPYGEPAYDNWGGSRFRYTGQMMLPEARLYHYKARVYDPVLGRFLQTDPVGYSDDFNLYAYVKNDPMNRSDPTGAYGRGDGFTDEEWKRFDKIQRAAAGDMERRAARFEAKADKLDAKGKSGGSDLRATAGHLREGAAALRSDGSDGKMANQVDSATYQKMGGTENGAAFVRGNGPIMTVNKDNAAAWSVGGMMPKWVVGHESLHTSGLNDQVGSNGKTAYKFGNDAQKEAFKELFGTPRR